MYIFVSEREKTCIFALLYLAVMLCILILNLVSFLYRWEIDKIDICKKIRN